MLETAFTNILLVATPAGGDAQRRPRLRQRLAVDPVRRGPAHGQRLRHADGGARRGGQHPASSTSRSSGTSGTRTRRSTRWSAGRRSTARGTGRGATRRSGRSGSSTTSSATTSTGSASSGSSRRPAWRRRPTTCTWSHHTLGQVLSAVWPLNFWRSDAMDPADFEWFENALPRLVVGLPGLLGGLRGADRPGRRAHDPAGAARSAADLPGLPAAVRDAAARPQRGQDHRAGRPAATPCCSEGCEWIFRTWPEAYTGRKQVWAKYHGWDLADVILDLGCCGPTAHADRPAAAGDGADVDDRRHPQARTTRSRTRCRPERANAPAGPVVAMIDITVQPFGHSYECADGQTLLDGRAAPEPAAALRLQARRVRELQGAPGRRGRRRARVVVRADRPRPGRRPGPRVRQRPAGAVHDRRRARVGCPRRSSSPGTRRGSFDATVAELRAR